MCGIAGAVGPSNPSERGEVLRTMGEALVHRGPDDCGTYLDAEAGLVSRRLSIIDVSGGQQPLFNENRSVVCVCNGEIYNYEELRARLEGKGHRFRTRSDSEVLVHLYEERGARLVEELRGMFAFAIWDAARRTLLLARDPFGIKPLVYAERGRQLYFASEAKSIVAAGVPAALDLTALRDIASFGFVVTPRTLFAGIQRLPPGHLLEWRDGTHQLRRYWEPSFAAPAEQRSQGVKECARELRDRLSESVRVHLQSDVPVAVMLSGGLDSSAVLALASLHSRRRLTAFSLGFDQPQYDEFDGQLTLRGDPRWDSVHVRCGDEHVGWLPDAIWHAERPLIGIEVSRLVVARAIREHGFKVVLTGEGADELFAGYRWYHGQRVIELLEKLPRSVRRSLALVATRTHPRWARLLRAGDLEGMARFASLAGFSDGPSLRSLLTADLAHEDPVPALFPAPGQPLQSWDGFAQLQYYDQRVRLPDFVIDNLDSACMAASVEARVPFLDREVVAWAHALPRNLKMRGLKEKYVLREAMRGVLPEAIRTRSKRGLPSPVPEWLRKPLPEPLEALLAPPALARLGLFRADRVAAGLERYRARDRIDTGEAFLLWRVLSLQVWLDLFCGNGRTVSVSGSLRQIQ